MVAAAACRAQRQDFPFRPDSDFYYLTHFPEPDAVAVLVPGRQYGEYILFCREKNPEKEIWEGLRAGQEGADEQYGADDSFPITDIDDILPGLLENRDKVFCSMGRYPDLVVHRMLRRLMEDGALGEGEEREALESELVRLGETCSSAERRAETAERAAVESGG